jgi:hypothetical protein
MGRQRQADETRRISESLTMTYESPNDEVVAAVEELRVSVNKVLGTLMAAGAILDHFSKQCDVNTSIIVDQEKRIQFLETMLGAEE